MPIEVGIWKFGDGLKRVKMQSLDSESRLEDCLCADLSILSPGPFGHEWGITTRLHDMTPSEIQAAAAKLFENAAD